MKESYSVKSKSRAGARWIGSNTFISFILSFVQIFILTKFISPVEYGIMGVVTSFISLVFVIENFGIGSAIIQKKDINKLQLSSLYWITVFLGLILFIFMYFNASSIGSFYSEPQIVKIIKLMSLNFLIASLGSQFSILLNKYMQFKELTIISIFSLISSFLVAVYLAIKGYGVWSLVFSMIVKQAIQTLLLIIIAVRYDWLPQFVFSFRSISSILNFGIYHFGGRVLGKLHSRGDQLIIGKVLGPSSLGIYNISFQIVAQPMEKITSLFQKVAFPAYSQLQNDSYKLKKGFLKIIGLQIFILSPILLGIASTSNNFVPIFLGDKWLESINIIKAFSFFTLFKSIIWASKVVVLSKGHAKKNFIWQLFVISIILPSVYFISKYFNLYVVSFSLAGLFFSFIFIYFHFFIKKVISIKILDYITAIFRPVLYSLIMLVIISLYDLIQLSNFSIISLKIISGIAVYMILSYYFLRDFIAEIYTIFPTRLKIFISKQRFLKQYFSVK